MEDKYQERYLKHQERKTLAFKEFKGEVKKEYSPQEKSLIKEIMTNRRSVRFFNEDPISEENLREVLEAIQIAPSSCNRQAVYVVEADKIYLEQVLVGGRNWLQNADKVLLVFASKDAYKSPNEKTFMPYLDAGFVGQNIYLICETIGLGCCFINPNIREENKQSFVERYGEDYFCGAFALGNYNIKPKSFSLRTLEEILKKEEY